jgi:3-oxoacyl-[acyl-carrier-protein] synthase-3
MKQLVRKVKIIGTGSYVPPKIYTNKYLETLVDTNDEWIQKTLGIKERRIAANNEATSDLAWRAGYNAILDSGLNKDDIDLIIVATSTPDRLAPSTAAITQDKLQAYNSVAFDISAVCSGFLYGMSVASQFIASGIYDNVLVIGADTFSKITNWTKRDCVFFGDGSGAAVLSSANINEGFIAFRLYTDGRGHKSFTIPAGGSEMPCTKETLEKGLHYFYMDGKAVYDTGTRVLPIAIFQVLSDTGLTIEDINLMIPHQPSIGILKETARIINLPFEKVMTNMDKYANTSGATIPLILDEVNKAGKIKNGSNILFASVGSGWTYGASIIKWSQGK